MTEHAKIRPGDFLFDIADALICGHPVVAIIASADDESDTYVDIVECPTTGQLSAADRRGLLRLAISELEAKTRSD